MKKTVVYAVILSAVSIIMGIVVGVAIERGNTIKHLSLSERSPQSLERQAGFRGEQRPQDIFKRIAEELNLDKEQKESVKRILDEARKKLSQMGDNKSREEVKAIRDESHTKIVELLTPEQQEKFKIIVARVQKQRPERGQRPNSPENIDGPGPDDQPPDAPNNPEGAPFDVPEAP